MSNSGEASSSQDDTSMPAKATVKRKLEETESEQQTDSVSSSSKRSAIMVLRTKSDLFSPTLDDLPYKINDARFKAIIQSLNNQLIDTSRMDSGHLHYLFLNPYSEQSDLQIFQRLRDSPLTVSNDELQQLLLDQLEESTAQSAPTKEGNHFYFRSWTLTCEKLIELVRLMKAEENDTAETFLWMKSAMIHGLEARNRDRIFTIRYVGTTTGPRTPYQEDMLQRKDSSFPGTFMRMAEQFFPGVADAAQVFLIKSASLPASASKHSVDDVERVLVEYLGHETLLNRQRGGLFASYVPETMDVQVFRGFETRFYYRFMTDAQVMNEIRNPGMIEALRVHFYSLQQFANTNPQLTGTGRHAYTDGVRDAAHKTAMPMQYKECTILSIFGKDITLEEFIGEVGFWKGKSLAKEITKDALIRLAITEERNNGQYLGHYQFDLSFAPLFNLWPWLWHVNNNAICSWSRRYLTITRPLIVVVFSLPVYHLIRSSFQRKPDLERHACMSSVVGDLTVQYYTDSEDATLNEEDAFIAIPHICPDSEKYPRTTQVLIRRLTELTWQFTFLVADTALDLIDDLETEGRIMSRRAMCLEILDRVHKRESEEPFLVEFKMNLHSLRGHVLRALTTQI